MGIIYDLVEKPLKKLFYSKSESVSQTEGSASAAVSD